MSLLVILKLPLLPVRGSPHLLCQHTTIHALQKAVSLLCDHQQTTASSIQQLHLSMYPPLQTQQGQTLHAVSWHPQQDSAELVRQQATASPGISMAQIMLLPLLAQTLLLSLHKPSGCQLHLLSWTTNMQ